MSRGSSVSIQTTLWAGRQENQVLITDVDRVVHIGSEAHLANYLKEIQRGFPGGKSYRGVELPDHPSLYTET
jgi:hypothetical protein